MLMLMLSFLLLIPPPPLSFLLLLLLLLLLFSQSVSMIVHQSLYEENQVYEALGSVANLGMANVHQVRLKRLARMEHSFRRRKHPLEAYLL